MIKPLKPQFTKPQFKKNLSEFQAKILWSDRKLFNGLARFFFSNPMAIAAEGQKPKENQIPNQVFKDFMRDAIDEVIFRIAKLERIKPELVRAEMLELQMSSMPDKQYPFVINLVWRDIYFMQVVCPIKKGNKPWQWAFEKK
jgi:hypothetical protein